MDDTRSVIQLGDPRLRQRAVSVDDFEDVALQSLIDDLIATATAKQGVGIAAPQVAVNQRLFVVASRPNLRYPQAPTMVPTPMVNPEILSHGDQVVKGWEGCLSVPGIRGLVPRYQTIEVTYQNRQGQPQRQVLTDFVARIFQHELDHLAGKVFLDRVENTHDLMTEDEFQKRVVFS